ncbi:MAG: hypothetical protein JXR18_03340 [Neptuniibacter sp.]
MLLVDDCNQNGNGFQKADAFWSALRYEKNQKSKAVRFSFSWQPQSGVLAVAKLRSRHSLRQRRVLLGLISTQDKGTLDHIKIRMVVEYMRQRE